MLRKKEQFQYLEAVEHRFQAYIYTMHGKINMASLLEWGHMTAK